MGIKGFVTIVYGLMLFTFCRAQQEALYSQYYFNQLAINPAYAGNNDALNLTGLSRKQWFGIDGSPTTFTVFGHTPILNNLLAKVNGEKYGNQVGVGIVLMNDHIGINNTFISSFAYSYKILLNDERRLSFGLQGSVLNFRQAFNKLDNINTMDPVFQDNISITTFNVGTGVFYESSRYYVGFSVPEIIENRLSPESSSVARQLRQYFLTGGYVFYLNLNFKVKPTFLVRYTEGMPPGFDISANLLYRDKIWAGIAYRYHNSINVTGELLVSPKLRIGLAYDYPVGVIHFVTHGSAEILLSYTFQKNKKLIINPRYF
jgi:type IX secretion system PorP/SprF family membrane protein